MKDKTIYRIKTASAILFGVGLLGIINGLKSQGEIKTYTLIFASFLCMLSFAGTILLLVKGKGTLKEKLFSR